MKEAGLWSLVWVLVSFAFVGWLWWYLGGLADNPVADAKALEFVTGYLVEKALAVDNIFVFLMVFTYFAVPAEHQKRVLMIGILGALVLRAILILVGAWLLAQFHWLLYVFGAFLVLTGVKMWWAAGQEPDLGHNPALKWIRRHLKIAPNFDGEKFFTVQDGVRMATPLFVVIMMIGIVDIVFAVDSIPAIFAITTDPFIVLTSNVFAILGLRAMYFLLAACTSGFTCCRTAWRSSWCSSAARCCCRRLQDPGGVVARRHGGELVLTMLLSLKIPPKDKPLRPGTSSLAGAPSARLKSAAAAAERRRSAP